MRNSGSEGGVGSARNVALTCERRLRHNVSVFRANSFTAFGMATATSDDSANRQEAVVDDDRRELSLDRVSFDEMNLVELPFSLLTRDTDGIYEIPLSSDGKSRLACLNSSEYGLPNSLAPRVVLGLMWMWKNECDNSAQSFSVRVRDLVVRYMHPDRYKTYPPGGELLQSVERQINCVANSRIHTDRWWNHDRRQRQKANISIISDVTVLDEGGFSRPRVLRVTWGREFFESMVRRYTKPLDARLVQRLENPLDLQLYRLLDRQLADKSRQHYSSIVDFARFKLGMRGYKVDAGGRTASSYVAKKLTEAIRRLSSEQFTVRMTIDRAVVPFTVTFERLANSKPKQPHEVHDHDLAAALVREFLLCAHGLARDQKRTRLAEADRAAANAWLEAYGFEQAKWMVRNCVKMQKQRGAPRILVFRGLGLYESAAASAYEQHLVVEEGRRERQVAQEVDAYWNAYCERVVRLFESRTSAEELVALESDIREQLKREKPEAPAFIVDAHLRSRLNDAKFARMNALSEDEFRRHQSLRTLQAAIVERHGIDLMRGDGAAPEGDSLQEVAANPGPR